MFMLLDILVYTGSMVPLVVSWLWTAAQFHIKQTQSGSRTAGRVEGLSKLDRISSACRCPRHAKIE